MSEGESLENARITEVSQFGYEQGKSLRIPTVKLGYTSMYRVLFEAHESLWDAASLTASLAERRYLGRSQWGMSAYAISLRFNSIESDAPIVVSGTMLDNFIRLNNPSQMWEYPGGYIQTGYVLKLGSQLADETKAQASQSLPTPAHNQERFDLPPREVA